MVIQPKVRGFICITAHPDGCAANVRQQIEYVKSRGPVAGPKRVLVIGASQGFGLASRILSAFGSGASTLGLFFEKPGAEDRPASAGWYMTAAFEQEAHKAGLYAKSINGDAFSNDIKQKTIETIKADLGQVDLVIYSLAAPRRTHPDTGVVYASTLRPVGSTYENKTVNTQTGEVSQIKIDPASEEDVANTVGVMGGEDWQMWTELLVKENLLAPNAMTVAYSYIGPVITSPIYRNGTIGHAKEHLEKTAHSLDAFLKEKIGGRAFVSVNKALVTQASSAIPVIPLYIGLLYKVMKEKGVHEGCIEQIDRLYRERLFAGTEIPVDEKGRIRIDDWELREDVQAEVEKAWATVSTENFSEVSDYAGYQEEFHKLFGFGLPGIDYEADTNPDVKIQNIL
jgi:enoyl-[acyl-carrier protein] reductase / trans-2-enoyl-CoA reductase (NAD+)